MRWLLALCFAGLASASAAQTIHQYPYDPTVTAYGMPAAWPTLSAQCHWRPGNATPDPTMTPQLQSPSIAHLHVEAQAPIYAELSKSIIVPFTLVMFHVQGQFDPNYNALFGDLISHIVWDTPTGAPPAMMLGDPNGVVTFTGHVTIDFSKANGSGLQKYDIPKHGWFTVQLRSRLFFANGDHVDDSLNLPFYSVVDVKQPEQFFPQGGGGVGVECGPTSARDPQFGGAFGFAVVDYRAYLPILAPITSAVSVASPHLYGYQTSTHMPMGTGLTRMDMDLHHGFAGTLLQQGMGGPNDGVFLPSPFDPAVLGPGVHKVASIWQQDSGMGNVDATANEQSSALLVVTVTVGGTPPPVPVWVTLPGLFQQQQSPNPALFRLCPDSTGMNCQAFTKN